MVKLVKVKDILTSFHSENIEYYKKWENTVIRFLISNISTRKKKNQPTNHKNTFKLLRKNKTKQNLEPRNLWQVKLSLKSDDKLKTFQAYGNIESLTLTDLCFKMFREVDL